MASRGINHGAQVMQRVNSLAILYDAYCLNEVIFSILKRKGKRKGKAKGKEKRCEREEGREQEAKELGRGNV